MAQPNTREEFADYWRPRTYYIMKNKTTGKLYMGQTATNVQKYLGFGSYWKNHCKAHGGYSRENIEIIYYEYFTNEKDAILFLDSFEKENPNYWLKENKLWANQCKENTDNNHNPFYDSEISAKNNAKRIKNGSHPFLKPNRTTKMNGSQYGGDLYTKYMIDRYGVDNPMKNPEISKKSGASQSRTKSNPKWKETVEPIRVLKANESLSEMCPNGKTKRENRNEKIGLANKKRNLEKVETGLHHYQNGFYVVLKDGSTKLVSSEEYSNCKKQGLDIYAHPTSYEGKKRRGIKNASSN